MAKATAPAGSQFFTVPAGTPAKLCKHGCGQRVYWIVTPKGRRTPVDCNVEGGVHPTALHDPAQLDAFGDAVATHDGRGVSHFVTCRDQQRDVS